MAGEYSDSSFEAKKLAIYYQMILYSQILSCPTTI